MGTRRYLKPDVITKPSDGLSRRGGDTYLKKKFKKVHLQNTSTSAAPEEMWSTIPILNETSILGTPYIITLLGPIWDPCHYAAHPAFGP